MRRLLHVRQCGPAESSPRNLSNAGNWDPRTGIERSGAYPISAPAIYLRQSMGPIDGHGYRADVGQSILANVANLISFRLGVEDARILAHRFEPGFSREER